MFDKIKAQIGKLLGIVSPSKDAAIDASEFSAGVLLGFDSLARQSPFDGPKLQALAVDPSWVQPAIPSGDSEPAAPRPPTPAERLDELIDGIIPDKFFRVEMNWHETVGGGEHYTFKGVYFDDTFTAAQLRAVADAMDEVMGKQ